jgi:putative nucleotidyltransferase with HDIG domain
MVEERRETARQNTLKDEKVPVDKEHVPTKLGLDFLAKFYRLLKGAGLYDRKNIHMDRLTEDCLEAIQAVMDLDGQLYLKLVRDNLFFNNYRLQVRADRYTVLRGLLQELRKRWIGEIEITEKITGEQLKEFIYLIVSVEENNETNYLVVNRKLEFRDIRMIHTGKLESFRDEDIYVDSEDQKRQSKDIYFKSINLVKEVMEGMKQQKALNVRKAKRLMQSAVNAIIQDDSTLLGLANIKNYDDYTFNHSVNVAIYAIALGQRIGVPKKHLAHLGMSGLFHDAGKTRIPKEILNKTEKLTAEEWVIMRAHPIIGAEIVISMKEWGELSTRMIDASFEHHLKYDLTGYPKLARRRKVSLFGRIVAIADLYDALVRPRVYNRYPFVSEKILGFMLERSGKDFDPALVKVFVNMLGVFPLGTLVLLNTNEMGIVAQVQEDTELIDHPKVWILSYSDGEYRKGKMVDLREMDETSGEFKRTIVKTLDPN